MSGFAVIYQRRVGTPASLGSLRPMMAVLAHRGPDGADTLADGPLAIGHHHFWTTPEEEGERQPLSASDGRVHLVLDGRLDNRRELLDSLDGEACSGPEPSDAALALAAYLRWGQRAFERLLGPFAVVVADPREGVLCARDPLGDRTLFYRATERLFVVASEEQAVLAHPAVSGRFDERRVAYQFAADVPSDGSTFFSDVSELRPGSLLRVGPEALDLERYASPVPIESVVLGDDGEYAECYLELLREAVVCRLRSIGSSGVMMSGGIDSTSLMAVAASTSSTASVRPVSWVFDELESCDERRFMEPVIESLALDPLRFAGDGFWPLSEPEVYSANPNAPEGNAYRALKQSLYARASGEGLRVLLGGGSADLFYHGVPRWPWGLLRQGRLFAAGLDAWAEVGKRGAAAMARSAARRLLEPGGDSRRRPAAPHWLTDIAKELISEDASRQPAGLRSFRRPGQAGEVLGARHAYSIAAEAGAANRGGVELRHPYRDRRLVDFMLAIPDHQLYGLGRHKQIARRALRGLLPRKIVERTTPSPLNPLFDRGIREREAGRVREILDRSDAVWPRFVRRDWLEQVLDGSAKEPAGEYVLWQCLAFELWRSRWGKAS